MQASTAIGCQTELRNNDATAWPLGVATEIALASVKTLASKSEYVISLTPSLMAILSANLLASAFRCSIAGTSAKPAPKGANGRSTGPPISRGISGQFIQRAFASSAWDSENGIGSEKCLASLCNKPSESV